MFLAKKLNPAKLHNTGGNRKGDLPPSQVSETKNYSTTKLVNHSTVGEQSELVGRLFDEYIEVAIMFHVPCRQFGVKIAAPEYIRPSGPFDGSPCILV